METNEPITTTTGFIALDGLPMGTLYGAPDPGVILYLVSEQPGESSAVADLFYHCSGLLNVLGESSGIQELLASYSPRAVEAIDLFVYRTGENWDCLLLT